MSEVAKDRLLVLGTRFATYEHENAKKNISNQLPMSSSILHQSVANTANTDKASFWKKNSSKVPGRPVYGAQHPPLQAVDAHLATYIKGSRMKFKNGNSFQDFEGSTLDAWDEGDDESHLPSSPFRQSQNEEICRPALERVNGDDLQDRQPQASGIQGSGIQEESRVSKPTSLKQMKLKITEKLAKVHGNRNLSPENELPYSFPPQPPSPIHQSSADMKDQENSRLEKFGKMLAGPITDIDQLRKLSWNGIPDVVRGNTWRLLSGYLPPNIDRRQETLKRKQSEYHNFVLQYYPTRHDQLHEETFRQIHIDIPRTNPLIPIFQQKVVQEIFERILFIWAIRHPASGYVQGINDLVVPFFMVFLAEHTDKEVQTYNVSNVKKEILDMVEADTFWCFSKLLDGIQDNYTFAQPGIQTKVNALKNLVNRIDAPLNQHISSHNIDYLQFTFRWMNNLLMRELPLKASIRLWDTYWAEKDGFAMFHLYVCAALLKRFSNEIKSKTEFQGVMILLQNLPCKDWNDDDISCLVAEAFRLQFMFADAPKHLSKK
uniref:TBC1 domain family member 22B n=1 Tax=Hydra vulgaris TaxID=6087 RepID=T2M4P9_HYDVU